MVAKAAELDKFTGLLKDPIKFMEAAGIKKEAILEAMVKGDTRTPEEIAQSVFDKRMGEEKAAAVMLTAHRRGACVIAVFTRDVAETKAKEATELGKSNGFPLYFTTEPEE
jgi:ATP-dependent Clp protease adaptor protein ClpS